MTCRPPNHGLATFFHVASPPSRSTARPLRPLEHHSASPPRPLSPPPSPSPLLSLSSLFTIHTTTSTPRRTHVHPPRLRRTAPLSNSIYPLRHMSRVPLRHTAHGHGRRLECLPSLCHARRLSATVCRHRLRTLDHVHGQEHQGFSVDGKFPTAAHGDSRVSQPTLWVSRALPIPPDAFASNQSPS